jgi:hypothetical protein
VAIRQTTFHNQPGCPWRPGFLLRPRHYCLPALVFPLHRWRFATMRTQMVTRSIVVVALVLLAIPAAALPPFNKEWTGKYVEGNSNDAFVKAVGVAKCNVCHDPASKSKKDHNVYGKVVKKYLTKADYDKIKTDMAASKKYILDGLEKAEAEKGADGKTYGEKLKAGTLPGG